MNYFEGLQLAATLPLKKKRAGFLAPPKDKKLDFDIWRSSDEAKLVFELLFKDTNTVVLTLSLSGRKTICLVFRESGFSERTQTDYETHGKWRTRMTYKPLTTTAAIAYSYGERDLVNKFREQAHQAMLAAISTAAGNALSYYLGRDRDFYGA